MKLFPETPITRLQYKNYKNILVKDESVNPTGTHKDRMAYALLPTYKRLISIKNQSKNNNSSPSFSLISAGNAAIAIANLFAKLELPKLKVLLDHKTASKYGEILLAMHCEVYETNIYEKSLKPDDILNLTNNSNGIDITSFALLENNTYYYSELVTHALTCSPDMILIPYGSGVLYENFSQLISLKYKLNTNCSYQDLIGVTTKNPNSKADKLYAPFSPFDYNPLRLNLFKQLGFIGQASNIVETQDFHFEEAVLLLRKNKIEAEYSGAAGLAFLLANEENLDPAKAYLVVNTGKGILFNK